MGAEDPARDREGSRARRPDPDRALLADPDDRPLHHVAARADRTQAQGGWWNFFAEPSKWTFENYRDMFDNEGIIHALWVTAQVTLGATILPIVVAAIAAYALAWIEFPGRDWLFLPSSASCSCRSRWR